MMSVFLVILLTSGSVLADEVRAKVISIQDGDTLEIAVDSKTTHRVRLVGIDAPEKSQPFAEKSKTSLSELTLGKDVRVEFFKLDTYGRLVGKVIQGSNDVGLEQVKKGMAWHYKQFQKDQRPQDRYLYSESEKAAKKSALGIWRDPEPKAPWKYRQAAKFSPRIAH